MARKRTALVEATPSTVVLTKHGGRETEKLLLTGDGCNAMVSEDGSVTIQIYTNEKTISMRLSPDDVQSQKHIFRQWRDLR